jgi:hypothetical protein
VMRASMVLVWHAGHGGWWIIMMLHLGQAGSVTELSVTVAERGGGARSMEPSRSRRCSILLTFRKVNSANFCGHRLALNVTAIPRQSRPTEAARKVHHDAEDQRACLYGLQRNGLPHGEATSAGNSQNLSGEVRGLCRQRKNCELDQLKRPYFALLGIAPALAAPGEVLVSQTELKEPTWGRTFI